MSADYVLDASALAKTFIREPDSAGFLAWFETTLAGDARLHAPGLIAYELGQVVKKALPDLNYPGDDPARALVREATQAIELDHEAWARIDPYLDRLSAYDATYLALAVAKTATLVTYDAYMAAAAQTAGVPVISPGT